MNNPDNIRQIDRLIRFWPQANLSDDAIRAYGEAAAGKDPRDVVIAVNRLITGKVERNHDFIPPPGQFAFQIDRAMNERLDDEARNRPRLRPPEQSQLTETERAERKAYINALMADFHASRPKTAPTAQQHYEAQRRTIREALGVDDDHLQAMLDSCKDRPQPHAQQP